MQYVYLAIAIVAEVIATSFMKQSEGFTKLVPSLITAGGYIVAFYFLSLTLRTLPTGIAYAIWSGVGIVAATALGLFVFGERLAPLQFGFLAMILVGAIGLHMTTTAG